MPSLVERCVLHDGHHTGNTTAANSPHHSSHCRPIFFTGVSMFYFRKFHYSTPFQTVLLFVGFVIAMDFFVVALLRNRSLEMFESRARDVDSLCLDVCVDLYH